MWAVAKTWAFFLYTNVRLPRFRGRSRTTIDFRSASANPGFQTPGFQAPSLRGASALRVFTSARSSYFKPKIKRIHGGFGRCSCAYTHLYIFIYIYILYCCKINNIAGVIYQNGYFQAESLPWTKKYRGSRQLSSWVQGGWGPGKWTCHPGGRAGDRIARSLCWPWP